MELISVEELLLEDIEMLDAKDVINKAESHNQVNDILYAVYGIHKEDYYDLDVYTNFTNTYIEEDYTSEDTSNYYFKLIDKETYGRYSDYDDPMQQYWLKGDSAFSASAEAEDFIETFKDKGY